MKQEQEIEGVGQTDQGIDNSAEVQEEVRQVSQLALRRWSLPRIILTLAAVGSVASLLAACGETELDRIHARATATAEASATASAVANAPIPRATVDAMLASARASSAPSAAPVSSEGSRPSAASKPAFVGTPVLGPSGSPDNGPSAAPSLAATAVAGGDGRKVGDCIVMPAPGEFDPGKGDVKNLDPKDWPKGKYEHYQTSRGEIDTYATYWANASDGMKAESHGNLGQVILQTEEGVEFAKFRLGVGTIMDYFDQRDGLKHVWLDKKRGNRGFNQNWKTQVSLKGLGFGVPVTVYDPTDCSVKGKGTTTTADSSNEGVVTVDLPNQGVRQIVADVIDHTKGSREVWVEAGPDDDPSPRINRIDTSS